ncbi:hypothetical protein VB738_15680 [Cyanobium gracile UHCC 0139]|uniref:Uncharacterized protein n=1 Tax=Cyanobium gracile UHCC 0139 TaxID=3110308 RepID=A0ABU5RY37_9CYAN|nr:hypothetical protein [Cyanobium gracile]MEA5392703.1 hypothetical protein [Cyanobium gracile UHCC 0139]
MLPTLAERLREQHAKSRGRRASHPPWPVPGEPPTALLFQTRVELASPVAPDVTALTAVPDPGLRLPVREAAVMGIEASECPEPELEAVPPAPVPPQPATERTRVAEMLLLLVWAVLVLIDGAVALASLLNGAADRQRRPQASTVSAVSPSAVPPFLMAAASP